jgi:cation transport ATPase
MAVEAGARRPERRTGTTARHRAAAASIMRSVEQHDRTDRETWETVERAEARLDERSEQRRASGARRARRSRILRWALRLLLPFAGAALFVAVIEGAGGDLGDWAPGAAAAFVVAALAWPALAAAWLSRRDGWLLAIAWAIGVFAVQGALIFGVAFAELGYGPE